MQDLLEAGEEFLVAGDCPVQDHQLVPVGRQDSRVVSHEHHQQDHGHQRQRQPQGFDPQARDESEGEG